MISEALELRVEGVIVSHSWCMCVVSHGCGGGRDGMHVGQGQRGLVACREMPEHCLCAR